MTITKFNLAAIQYGDERCTMADLVLKVVNSFRDDWFPDQNTWESLQFAMIMLSMYQIHLVGRAPSASDVARSTGMPRPTVQRKLAKLKKIGYVNQYGSRFELSIDGLNQPRLLDGFRKRLGIVKGALQKMLMLLTIHGTAA
jgi:hypothetical protein